MVTKALDLQEQEQLDELRHFWTDYGKILTAVLVVLVLAMGAWMGYQYWQKSQASKAATIYDQLNQAVESKDQAKIDRAFADLKADFAATAYAQQAGLVVAKQQYEANKSTEAAASLKWVSEQNDSYGYGSLARLRLATIHLEKKAYDEGLQVLNSGVAPEYEALADEARGDLYAAQGKLEDAKKAMQEAYTGLKPEDAYRGAIAVKLNSLGVDPSTFDKPAAQPAQ